MEERVPVKDFFNDCNSYDKGLRKNGYSHLERGIIYSGITIGMFVPIALTRYGIFPKTENNFIEASYWGASAVMNVGLSAIAKGFPLVYTGGLGALAGGLPAFGLKKWREGRRNSPRDQR